MRPSWYVSGYPFSFSFPPDFVVAFECDSRMMREDKLIHTGNEKFKA
jgi:hypothetical protein